MSNWQYVGDVNPLEGGLFFKKENDFEMIIVLPICGEENAFLTAHLFAFKEDVDDYVRKKIEKKWGFAPKVDVSFEKNIGWILHDMVWEIGVENFSPHYPNENLWDCYGPIRFSNEADTKKFCLNCIGKEKLHAIL